MSNIRKIIQSILAPFSTRPQQKTFSVNQEFFVETEPIDNGPGYWNYLRVSVFQNTGGVPKKIGEYTRNYNGMYHTFHPFQQDGKWFALYSKHYTCTSIMELPSCRDIASEEPNANGFCPVDFYVPYLEEHVVKAGEAGKFGLMAGCIWGDDSSWKIQYLDLSRIQSGILVREERFGYLAMPTKILRLMDCVSFIEFDPPDYPFITLTTEITFNIQNGNRYNLGDS